jgi:hypothetical protein
MLIAEWLEIMGEWIKRVIDQAKRKEKDTEGNENAQGGLRVMIGGKMVPADRKPTGSFKDLPKK